MKVKIIFPDNTSQMINISRAILLDWKHSWTCWVNNKQYDIQATIQQPSTCLYEMCVAEHRKDDKQKNMDELIASDLAVYDEQQEYVKDGLIRTKLFIEAQNDLAITHFGLPIHQVTKYNPPIFDKIIIETDVFAKIPEDTSEDSYGEIIAGNALIPYCSYFACATCPVFLESGYACGENGSIFQAFDKTFDEADRVSKEIFISELFCLVNDFNDNIEKSLEKIELNKKEVKWN